MLQILQIFTKLVNGFIELYRKNWTIILYDNIIGLLLSENIALVLACKYHKPPYKREDKRKYEENKAFKARAHHPCGRVHDEGAGKG
jgi:hypothetical protein